LFFFFKIMQIFLKLNQEPTKPVQTDFIGFHKKSIGFHQNCNPWFCGASTQSSCIEFACMKIMLYITS
jgi:hypothetical protein